MSHMILTDHAVSALLAYGLIGQSGAAIVDGAKWALYTNNVIPTDSTVLADLTEASYPSYARLTDGQASYPSPSVSAHVASTTRSSALSWALPGSGGPFTVYGCFLVDSGGTNLLAATRFDSGPYQLAVAGTPVTETPTFTTQSLY